MNSILYSHIRRVGVLYLLIILLSFPTYSHAAEQGFLKSVWCKVISVVGAQCETKSEELEISGEDDSVLPIGAHESSRADVEILTVPANHATPAAAERVVQSVPSTNDTATVSWVESRLAQLRQELAISRAGVSITTKSSGGVSSSHLARQSDIIFDGLSDSIKSLESRMLTEQDVVALVGSSTVSSLWENNGSDISFTGGNVGIGTSVPASALHVYGVNDVTGGITIGSSVGTAQDRLAIFALGNLSTAFRKLSPTGAIQFQNSAGVADITFSANGYVGIGTTNPNNPLEIQASTSASSSVATLVNLVNNSSQAGSGSRLRFTGNSTFLQSSIESAWEPGGNSSASLAFINRQVGKGATEAMRITGMGNVGIGTAAPTQKLEVVGSAYLRNATTFGQTPVEQVRLGRSDVDTRYHSIYSVGHSGLVGGVNYNAIQFAVHDAVTPTSQTTVMSLVGNGNVGIGTTAPERRLVVVGDNETYLPFSARNTAGYGLVMGSFGSETFARIQSSQVGGSGTVNLVINPSGGSVGIGTTDPGASLHVEGNGTPNLQAIFVNSQAPSASAGSGLVAYTKGLPTAAGQRLGYLAFGSRGGAENQYHGALIGAFAEDAWSAGSSRPTYLTFETNPSGATSRVERMRITAGGNVGIGTNAPSASLEIKSSTAFNPANAGAGNSLYIENISAGGGDGNYGGALTFSSALRDNVPQAAIAARQNGVDNDWVGLSFFTHLGAGGDAILSETMRLSHDGKLSLGEFTNNAATLSVYHYAPGRVELNTPTDVFSLGLKEYSSAADSVAGSGARMVFKIPTNGQTTTTGAGIAGIRESDNDLDTSAGLAFYTSQNDEILDEFMRITSAGNVGIGTTTPSEKLSVNGNVAVNGQVIIPIGSTATPSLTFSGLSTTGIHGSTIGSPRIRFTVAGATPVEFANNGIYLSNASTIGWSAAGLGGTVDTQVYRDEAGTLAQRRLANAQAFRIYNTTDANLTNYERGVFDWKTTSNVLRIGTEAGGTGLVRDIALVGGKVGIGTATPSSLLSVAGSMDVTGTTVLATTTIMNSLVVDGNLANGYGINFGPSGSPIASIFATDVFGDNGIYVMGTERASFGVGLGAGLFVNNDGADTFARLQADSAEIYTNFGDITLRSTSNIILETTVGNVGIGTTTPEHALTVVGNAQFTGIGSGTFGNDLSITANGVLTTMSSDRNLKEDDQNIDSSDTLAKMLLLRPVEFTWIEGGKRDMGLIAQEVEDIFPELVFTNEIDGYKGINYSRFTALLIASVQELASQLKDIKAWFAGGRLNIQNDVCVDDVCISKEQFKQMLLDSGNSSHSGGSGSSEGSSGSENQAQGAADGSGDGDSVAGDMSGNDALNNATGSADGSGNVGDSTGGGQGGLSNTGADDAAPASDQQ